MTAALPIDADRFLMDLEKAARASGAFGVVERLPDGLRCQAKDAAAEAWYSVVRDPSAPDGCGWTVRLATADRWLSESIETDLMHYGDPIEELVEDELVELGHIIATDGPMPAVRHFRSDDKLYTFETSIPLDRGRTGGDHAASDELGHAVRVATRFLMAYEAAFRQLGDMDGDDESDR